jgi:hypothetical protein
MRLAVSIERRRNSTIMRSALLCLRSLNDALPYRWNEDAVRVYMYWRRLLHRFFDAWSRLLEGRKRRTLANLKGDQYDRELRRRSFLLLHDHSVLQQQCRARHLSDFATKLLAKANSKSDCSQVRDAFSRWRSYLGLVFIYRSLSSAHVSFILRGVVKRYATKHTH